jgi:hypothetical protein
MTNEVAIHNLFVLKLRSKLTSDKEALDMAIKALEQQPKMQDCEHCIHTYGTLGCCDMVNNEWVYDCDFGKEQYKKEHETQPCEDCISRQVVKDMLTAEWTKYMPMELDINLSFVLEKISELPSVTPTRPKGKWIQTKDDCDGVNFYDFSFECSKCGKEQSFKSSYCPICGAYMRESEETK